MIQQAPGASAAISWIVVNTHPRKERFAVESLNRQQFTAYCPMLLKRIRHARRSELVLRPMFPAHIFAGLHVGQRWRPIVLTTPGVSTIVRSGDLLNFLPAGFVEALQAYDVDGKVVAPDGSEQRGAEPSAHFSTVITTMVQMSERDRLLALIGLLRPGTDLVGDRSCAGKMD